MTDIINAELIREPTNKEREDFIPLTEDSPIDEQRKIGTNIYHQMSTRNRSLLIKSADPTDLKILSCFNCFVKEFSKNLTDEDLEANFKKYQNRLKLAEVKKTRYTKGTYREEGVSLMTENCPYCGKSISFSFQRDEINPEAYKKLILKSNESSGEE